MSFLPDHVLLRIFNYVLQDFDEDNLQGHVNPDTLEEQLKINAENIANLLNLQKVSDHFATLTEFIWPKIPLRIDYLVMSNWETSLERECLQVAPVLGTLIFYHLYDPNDIAKVAATLSKHRPRRIRKLTFERIKTTQSDFSTILSFFADQLEELSILSIFTDYPLFVGRLPKLQKLTTIKDSAFTRKQGHSFLELGDLYLGGSSASAVLSGNQKILFSVRSRLKTLELNACHRSILPPSSLELPDLDFPRLGNLNLNSNVKKCSCLDCTEVCAQPNSEAKMIALEGVETYRSIYHSTLILYFGCMLLTYALIDPIYMKYMHTRQERCPVWPYKGKILLSELLERVPDVKFFDLNVCEKFLEKDDWKNDKREPYVKWDITGRQCDSFKACVLFIASFRHWPEDKQMNVLEETAQTPNFQRELLKMFHQKRNRYLLGVKDAGIPLTTSTPPLKK